MRYKVGNTYRDDDMVLCSWLDSWLRNSYASVCVYMYIGVQRLWFRCSTLRNLSNFSNVLQVSKKWSCDTVSMSVLACADWRLTSPGSATCHIRNIVGVWLPCYGNKTLFRFNVENHPSLWVSTSFYIQQFIVFYRRFVDQS